MLSVVAFLVHRIEFAWGSCRRRICSIAIVDGGIVVAVAVTFGTVGGCWAGQGTDSVVVGRGIDVHRRGWWARTVAFVATTGEMRQGHAEFLPELLVVPFDAGAGAEVVAHIHVDVALRQVTVEDEYETLPALNHLVEGTFVLESGPFVVEEVLREHQNDHFGAFSCFENSIGDVGVQVGVTIVEVESVSNVSFESMG